MKRKTFFRQNENSLRFKNIVYEHYQEILSLQKEKQKIEEKTENFFDDTDELFKYKAELLMLEHAIISQAYIVIMFASASLEAYIWDYGARKLSDSFMKKHLDKLDIVSKWIVIPQMVTGKKVARGHHALAHLKQLSKARNAIVHTKSSSISENSELSQAKNKEEKVLAEVENAIGTLEELQQMLVDIDPDENNALIIQAGF